MQNKLPSKFVVIAFTVVALITGVLLFALYKTNKEKGVQNIPQDEIPSPIPGGQLPRVEKSFSQDALKLFNPNTDTTFYFLKVILSEDVSFDAPTGNAIGKFYFANDPAKTIFNYSLPVKNDGKFHMGYYLKDFNSESRWNLRSKNELINYARAGTSAEIRSQFEKSSEENADKISNIDSIFDAEDPDQAVFDDFVFEASAIGFIEQ